MKTLMLALAWLLSATYLGPQEVTPTPSRDNQVPVKEHTLRDAPTFVNRIGPFELFKSTMADVRRVPGDTRNGVVVEVEVGRSEMT